MTDEATVTIEGDESLFSIGRVYIVAIGVDRYVETKLNLRFAAADAIAFGNVLGKGLRYSDPIVVSLLDEKATKGHLLDALGGCRASLQ